ncbi:MAG: TM2 domain-containing protein [Treponema sp.]|nr:TM2 domain-containing protein [Treponema sp.]
MPTESSKSQLVAALLAFFLDEFGAHRFYVGKKKSAAAQLILSIVGFILCFVCNAEKKSAIVQNFVRTAVKSGVRQKNLRADI